jgi:hypothetical protein
VIPQRQGKRQSPLVANNTNNLLCASSAGKVVTVVGVNAGVGVLVAVDVKVGGIVSVGDALTSKTGAVAEDVIVLSVDCVQPVTIITKSNKLNH